MGLCSFLLSYVATIFLLQTDQEGSWVALDLMHTKGMIKDRKFILLSYKMHFLNSSLKKEIKDLRMSKFNVVITKLEGLLACGSLNVVLMTNLSSCGSLPFFPHYTMGQKTPKPTWPQLKHVGPFCSVCCLIQMDPERRTVLWCHGAIFY